ncbi:hypothetical protein ACFFRR_008829 [Megaselia abdita]
MNTNHKMKSFILKLMAFICIFGLRNNCISALYVNSDSTSSSKSLQPVPSTNSKFDLDWLAALRQPSSSSSSTNLNRKYKYFLTKKEKEDGRNNNPPSSLSHSLQKRQKIQEDGSVASFRLPQQKNNNNHRQIIYAKTKVNNYNNHKRSGYNNNNNYYNEMMSEPAMSSNTMLRSPRGQRQYDVPQIECPLAMDGMERFACPTPDRQGRYRCIDEHVLCDGFMDCPEAEDEDFKSCMFYKTTKAHLDVVADALLRWARGRR